MSLFYVFFFVGIVGQIASIVLLYQASHVEMRVVKDTEEATYPKFQAYPLLKTAVVKAQEQRATAVTLLAISLALIILGHIGLFLVRVYA